MTDTTKEAKATEKPAHGTGEWAAHNVNIQSGCGNGCAYCYASAMAVRFGRKTPDTWGVPEVVQKKVNQRFCRKKGRIMFPTTHDIDARNIDVCVVALNNMLAAGNEVLVVSKPRLDCVRRLCAELDAFKGQITFRFTIGSADDSVLSAWEPGAPSFDERIASLEHAFDSGFKTSVSCEPMLDGNIHAVIEAARPFVSDSIWLGKANQLRQIVAMHHPGDAMTKAMADALIATVSDEHVRGLYARYRVDPVIKWKDSLKKVLGIERPTAKGLDV
jgi:DNA repair photolyase